MFPNTHHPVLEPGRNLDELGAGSDWHAVDAHPRRVHQVTFLKVDSDAHVHPAAVVDGPDVELAARQTLEATICARQDKVQRFQRLP